MNYNAGRNPLAATVLIVEDDRRLLTALTTWLKEMGCRCIACDNVSEAMVHYSRDSIDLVITDMIMPGVDGLSVLGLIRDQSDIPIIVITGHSADFRHLISGYRNVSVISKPFEPKTLISCVRNFLSSKELPAGLKR